MTVRVVTFDGVRYDTSDSNANAEHWVGGGQAPASEAQNAYQNALAVNKKVTASVLTGVALAGAGSEDISSPGLVFVKSYVADFGDVNATFGVSYGIGSSSSAYYKYNIAGSGAKLPVYSTYPSQGGYILTGINPNIAAWRDGSGAGSPSLNVADWFGSQCNMINGNAKSENFALDSVDLGYGLVIVSGTGADPQAKFTDFRAVDQDVIANRWGCCAGSGDSLEAWCLFRIGGEATETDFFDETSRVTFKDGYHSRGLVGVYIDLDVAASLCTMGALLIGEGTRNGVDANDTRPDFTVTGTTQTADAFVPGTLKNFRDVFFNSKVDCSGDIECFDLTMGGAHFHDGIFRPTSLSAVAACDDAVFGTSSGAHDLDVIQAGAGHAFAITGDVTLSNLAFSGFGADASNDAAILVNTTDPITITLDGTTNMTYRTIGTGNVTISNPKIATLSFNFKGVLPANFEWRLYEDDATEGIIGSVELDGEESKTTFTDETYNYTYTTDEPVILQVIADGYEEALKSFTLGDANQTQVIDVEPDVNL
jgi:hypothetical protein